MVAFDLAKMTQCWVCGSPVIFLGPEALSNSKRICSEVCVVIDDQMTPGEWIDASKEWPRVPLSDMRRCVIRIAMSVPYFFGLPDPLRAGRTGTKVAPLTLVGGRGLP